MASQLVQFSRSKQQQKNATTYISTNLRVYHGYGDGGKEVGNQGGSGGEDGSDQDGKT